MIPTAGSTSTLIAACSNRPCRFDAISPGENYLLGIFMTGAYQETLGDIHNLFGDTDSVDVWTTDDGFRLDNARSGDSADVLLELVGYDSRALDGPPAAPGLLPPAWKLTKPSDWNDLLAEGLSAYTYLETLTLPGNPTGKPDMNQTDTEKTIGWIGLGAMGWPMAGHLHAKRLG